MSYDLKNGVTMRRKYVILLILAIVYSQLKGKSVEVDTPLKSIIVTFCCQKILPIKRPKTSFS